MKSKTRPKLFIPGPVHVDDTVLASMSNYPVGHRTEEFSGLYREVESGIQRILFTRNRVFLATCSGTGLMEAAVRNTVRKRCANFICGAFSERWHAITARSGLPCDPFRVEPGRAIKPEFVRDALRSGDYDVATVVHNETSTGVMNPIDLIAETVRDFPGVLLLVDMVSSMAAVKVEVDALGIDVALASVQKGWALPPGFSVCSVSSRALERSLEATGKGYYFDFQIMEKYARKAQTPTTPSLPHLYALRTQLNRIGREGLENRFSRHREMARCARSWASRRFRLFAEKGYESDTVTCVKNNRAIKTSRFLLRLLDKGYRISGGYGPLKDTTFRIAHMGDVQMSDLEELLTVMDSVLDEMTP
ncbi:MAG: pyridoxal-phosphate-dependent aminotransferase family protein [Fidelibacterota bacterium]